MRKPRSKTWLYLQLSFWAVFWLIEVGAPSDFQDFLRADFWRNLGTGLLIVLALAAAILGVCYAYYRFCLWFGRAIDGKRSRIADRVAAREGLIAWPASDPLHDPELDA
jgi:hypothetical protein